MKLPGPNVDLFRQCKLMSCICSAQAVKDFEYRRVRVTGVYDHTKEMLLGPRTRGDGNSGYFLITPLRRENGSIVLVKRGWVPTEKKEQSTRPESLDESVQEIEGLLRGTEMVCTLRCYRVTMSYVLTNSFAEKLIHP